MCMAKQAKKARPQQEKDWDSDAKPIVADTAASKTVTPVFLDLIDPVPCESSLTGIGESQITHRGQVWWEVLDVDGKVQVLEDDKVHHSPDTPH